MKIKLILEKESGSLWGRVSYDKNLIIDSATTLSALENKLKKVLKAFHDIDNIDFDYQYDLTAFFEQFSFLNQSKIAELAGINPGLLRQYTSGVKHPSKAQAQKIQTAIRDLAARLKSVRIYA
jgi:hypothetical protein